MSICKVLRYVTIYTGLGVCIHWTGLLDWTTGLDYWTELLDWTTGLTLELTFELFLLSMIKIAVVLLAKLNLGIWDKLSGYLAMIQVSLNSYVTYPED